MTYQVRGTHEVMRISQWLPPKAEYPPIANVLNVYARFLGALYDHFIQFID